MPTVVLNVGARIGSMVLARTVATMGAVGRSMNCVRTVGAMTVGTTMCCVTQTLGTKTREGRIVQADQGS